MNLLIKTIAPGFLTWIPAFAGMTERESGNDRKGKREWQKEDTGMKNRGRRVSEERELQKGGRIPFRRFCRSGKNPF